MDNEKIEGEKTISRSDSSEFLPPRSEELLPISVEEFEITRDTDFRLIELLVNTQKAAQQGEPYIQNNSRSYLLLDLFNKDKKASPDIQVEESQKLAYYQRYFNKDSESITPESFYGTSWVKISRKLGAEEIELIVPAGDGATQLKELLDGRGMEEYLDIVSKIQGEWDNNHLRTTIKNIRDLAIDLSQHLPHEDESWMVLKFGQHTMMPADAEAFKFIKDTVEAYYASIYLNSQSVDLFDNTIYNTIDSKIAMLNEDPFVLVYQNIDGINIGFIYDGLSPKEAKRISHTFPISIKQILSFIPKRFQSQELDVFYSDRYMFRQNRHASASKELIYMGSEKAMNFMTTPGMSFENTFSHEAVHQMLDRTAGRSQSRYLIEGVAVWIGNYKGDLSTIKENPIGKSPSDYLKDWDRFKELPNNGHDEYWLGLLLSTFILEKFGSDKLFNLYELSASPDISKLANPRTDKEILNAVLNKGLGIEFEDFMSQFKDYLSKKVE